MRGPALETDGFVACEDVDGRVGDKGKFGGDVCTKFGDRGPREL